VVGLFYLHDGWVEVAGDREVRVAVHVLDCVHVLAQELFGFLYGR
jgi:hypothetical protein